MQEDSLTALHSSWEALAKKFPIIGVLAIVCGLIAFGLVKQLPASYDVNVSYMISMKEREAAAGFRYDGYYALSATDLFSATLAGVATSPETIVAAYKEAGLPLPTQDSFVLGKSVRADKIASQLVRVRVTQASKDSAEKLSQGLMKVLNRSVTQYNEKGNATITFAAVATDPWTSTQVLAPLPVAVSVMIFVALGGSFVVLFREALARSTP